MFASEARDPETVVSSLEAPFNSKTLPTPERFEEIHAAGKGSRSRYATATLPGFGIARGANLCYIRTSMNRVAQRRSCCRLSNQFDGCPR